MGARAWSIINHARTAKNGPGVYIRWPRRATFRARSFALRALRLALRQNISGWVSGWGGPAIPAEKGNAPNSALGALRAVQTTFRAPRSALRASRPALRKKISWLCALVLRSSFDHGWTERDSSTSAVTVFTQEFVIGRGSIIYDNNSPHRESRVTARVRAKASYRAMAATTWWIK